MACRRLYQMLFPGTAVQSYSVSWAAGDNGLMNDDKDSIVNTMLAAPTAAGDSCLTVSDASDIHNDDIIVIQFNGINQEVVVVVDSSVAPVICIDPCITSNFPPGTTVQERRAFDTSLYAGYPLIEIDTPAELEANMSIMVEDVFETDRVVITDIYSALPGITITGALVSIDDILVDSEGDRYNYEAGSPVQIK